VISGAGLCLSDGAILDLPPFSNMRENVMWIDDHLKYALHHELRHFGSKQGKRHRARVKSALFIQNRHENGLTLKDVRFHTKYYMERLIRGCLVDSWLRADTRLNQDLSGLSRRKFDEVMRTVAGPYSRVFRVRFRAGNLNLQAKRELKEKLWRRAQERLTDLVTAWSAPPYDDTYLQAFVDGEETLRTCEFLPKVLPHGLREAVMLLNPPKPTREVRRCPGLTTSSTT